MSSFTAGGVYPRGGAGGPEARQKSRLRAGDRISVADHARDAESARPDDHASGQVTQE